MLLDKILQVMNLVTNIHAAHLSVGDIGPKSSYFVDKVGQVYTSACHTFLRIHPLNFAVNSHGNVNSECH